MSNPDSGRTSGGVFRAALARVLGPATMARIVDPVLADFHQEVSASRASGRPWLRLFLRVRWTGALIAALLFNVLVRPTDAVERDAGGRMLAGTAVGGFALVGLFWALYVGSDLIRMLNGGHLLFVPRLVNLLPSLLVIAIPFGVLFGALGSRPLARREPTVRLSRPVIGVAVVAALLTLSLVLWVVPSANQAYRVSLFRSVAETGGKPLPPLGVREMSWSQLRNLASNESPADSRVRTNLYQMERHRRLAIAAACLVFGWFGAVFATKRVSRSTFLRVTVAAVSVVVYYALFAWGASLTAYSVDSVAPIWIANLVFAAAAGVVGMARARATQRRSLAV